MNWSGFCLPTLAAVAIASCARSDIYAERAWVRLPPPGAPSAAAYFTLTNAQRADARLTGVRADAFAAATIHQTRTVNGLTQMIDAMPLTIAAGSSAQFSPGAAHVMLMNPNHALREGDTIVIELQFDGREPLLIAAEVRRDAP